MKNKGGEIPFPHPKIIKRYKYPGIQFQNTFFSTNTITAIGNTIIRIMMNQVVHFTVDWLSQLYYLCKPHIHKYNQKLKDYFEFLNFRYSPPTPIKKHTIPIHKISLKTVTPSTRTMIKFCFPSVISILQRLPAGPLLPLPVSKLSYPFSHIMG